VLGKTLPWYSKIERAQKNKVLGEARFFRHEGLTFTMLDYGGDVPLLHFTKSNSEDFKFLSRSHSASGFTIQIVADF